MTRETRAAIADVIAVEDRTSVAPYALTKPELAKASMAALQNGDTDEALVLAVLRLGSR